MSEKPENTVTEGVESFDVFVRRVEPGLKQAFVARFGRSDGVGPRPKRSPMPGSTGLVFLRWRTRRDTSIGWE